MGKITKKEQKLHDEAMALLSLTRKLTEAEREFVFENYDPRAEHSVGVTGTFFTPLTLADDLASFAVGVKGRVIDLGAGIGVLAHSLRKRDAMNGIECDITEMVCVEANWDFAEIGRKLVPDAEWHTRSIFDKEFISSIGEFELAISNPPYGNIPSKVDGAWLKTKGPAQWLVIELIVRLTHMGAVLILPEQDTSYDLKNSRRRDPSPIAKKLKKFPGLTLDPIAMDVDHYKWKGAAPNVALADLSFDGVEFDTPFGFGDVICSKEPESKQVPLPSSAETTSSSAPKTTTETTTKRPESSEVLESEKDGSLIPCGS